MSEGARVVDPLLDVRGLTIAYEDRRGRVAEVVSHVSIEVHRGETVGLVGETGCGKSTLALALLGYLRDGSRVRGGAVYLNGTDLYSLQLRDLQKIRGRRIALVPQNAGQSLTPTMRVGEQVAEALRAHRRLSERVAQAEAVALLDRVRLPGPHKLVRRYPHQLSGGQQQRIAIAIALAGEPELLVLDEPTTGLDVTTQAHILDLLAEIRETTGAAIVCVSHDLGVVGRVSDRVAVMYAGEIVETGPTHELFLRPRHPYTAALLSSVPRLANPRLPDALSGRPPVPGHQPEGCNFSPRCYLADATCRSVAPLLEEIAPGADVLVRCHWWQHASDFEQRDAVGGRPEDRGQIADRQALLMVNRVTADYGRPRSPISARRILGSRLDPEERAHTLSDVTLTILRGETLALVGESGSGKSTLARTIMGLQDLRRGEVKFRDHVLHHKAGRRRVSERRAIQIVFQNPDASLNPRKTVGKSIERPLQLFLSVDRRKRRERALALVHDVGLGDAHLNRFPAQLSGGEKQRVAIARALAAEPEVVLCDEILSALDVSVQAAVLHLLDRLRREFDVAYLFISHDLAVVRAIADRVAVLYLGRICEIGTADEVFTPPYHPYTQTLLAAVLEPVPGIRPRVLSRTDQVDDPPPQRGCPFQHRCPRRVGPICDEETPPWRVTETGHSISCHLELAELRRPIEAPELADGASL